MNKKITVGLFCLMVASMVGKINAQTYQTLNVTSGYNADLIANGSGASSSSTTQSVDSPSNGYVFMSTDFVNGSGATPTSGLPNTGLVNSANTTGLSFQMASYSSNNSLKLSNFNDSGTISFGSTPKASKLFMLATTGSGSALAIIVVNFTDGSSQTFSNQLVNDWYGGSSFAIKGIGRVSRTSDAIENNINDPRLYEISMNISSSNQTKSISSVMVSKTSTSEGYLCVFGFSYRVPNACVTPDNPTSANITTNSATVSWMAISGVSSYELYKSTSATPPTSTTSATDTGITGASKNLTGLSAATTYNVWVRSNCGGGSVSDWSAAPANFTTMCGSVNVPYVENFNASAALPACTSTQEIVPSDDWGVTDGTGAANYSSNVLYIASPGMDATDTWFYTNGVNLQAGVSYTFSLDYASYYSPQDFKIAYGTSAVNTAMTNVVQSFVGLVPADYVTGTYTITPTATGVYYFGLNTNTPPTGSNYGFMLFDNISLTAAILSTTENQLSTGLQVYPNPTSDYLFIKNAQKASNMKIYDVSGKVVLAIDKSNQKIDVSSLVKGAYFLIVKNVDGTSSTHKFIKK